MFREHPNKIRRKEENKMQKFNQMTEDQMSQVDGGVVVVIAGLVASIVGAICGIICAGCSIANTVKDK